MTPAAFEAVAWMIWYAWYPVRLDSGRMAWRRPIEWSRQWEGGWGSDRLVNHYKEIR